MDEHQEVYPIIAALPIHRVRTMRVIAGKDLDTWEDCVTLSDLRAAGLYPEAQPLKCLWPSSDCRLYAISNSYCAMHTAEADAQRDAWSKKQQARRKAVKK